MVARVEITISKVFSLQAFKSKRKVVAQRLPFSKSDRNILKSALLSRQGWHRCVASCEVALLQESGSAAMYLLDSLHNLAAARSAESQIPSLKVNWLGCIPFSSTSLMQPGGATVVKRLKEYAQCSFSEQYSSRLIRVHHNTDWNYIKLFTYTYNEIDRISYFLPQRNPGKSLRYVSDREFAEGGERLIQDRVELARGSISSVAQSYHLPMFKSPYLGEALT